MEGEEFKKFGTAMMDYITNYLDNIRERKVLPSVEPGFMRDYLPPTAPQESEKWENILDDVEKIIMPGITHWQSPHFHAYFPAGNSYPSIVAEMLSAALGCVGFTWIASPAYTELEVVMMDWLGKMLGLPNHFLSKESNGKGGGVIQGSASDATLVTLLSARTRAIKKYKKHHGNEIDDSDILGKLVAYSSNQSHSSVEKAGILGAIKMKLLPVDENWSLDLNVFKETVKSDIQQGLIPFYAVATLGTTNSLAFDPIYEMGEICNEYGIWLHIDAAYAGAAFICEEFRPLMRGIEKVNSFNFNPHKWLQVNYDCSALWLKKSKYTTDAFNVDPLYLKHHAQGKAPDFRNWQIPLGRRFRALKLWFVLRIYGVKKLQEQIRSDVNFAKDFETLVLTDSRFEIVTPVIMGLVCFRLRDKTNQENEQLLKRINERGRIHMVPAMLGDTFIIRFAICSRQIRREDIGFAWTEIAEVTGQLFPNSLSSASDENNNVISQELKEIIAVS